MEVEQYEKWEVVEGITAPVGCAVVKEDEDGLSVIMIFSEVNGGIDRDLRLDFGRVPAYMIHEEFVHPWNITERVTLPKLEGKWERWSFPLLIVKNSAWLGSFSDVQLIHYPNCIHYRLLTMDQTVDVLCNNKVKVSWVTSQQAD
jgi:hypothetical protein